MNPGRYLRFRQFTLPLTIIIFSSIAGILSRKYDIYLPDFLADYTGDTMWALAFFALFRLLIPGLSLGNISLVALDFAYLIELSQLWHPRWLDAIRNTLPGGLLLGFGFLPTDLLCYAAGILIGLGIFSLTDRRL